MKTFLFICIVIFTIFCCGCNKKNNQLEYNLDNEYGNGNKENIFIINNKINNVNIGTLNNDNNKDMPNYYLIENIIGKYYYDSTEVIEEDFIIRSDVYYYLKCPFNKNIIYIEYTNENCFVLREIYIENDIEMHWSMTKIQFNDFNLENDSTPFYVYSIGDVLDAYEYYFIKNGIKKRAIASKDHGEQKIIYDLIYIRD